MKIYELQEVKQCTDIICDVCKNTCRKEEYQHSVEYATLSAMWGYWSNKDMERWTCDICETCADKVKDFIENQLKGRIIVQK